MSARIALLAGTRPECLKLVPVVQALQGSSVLEPVLIGSGQHPRMVRHTWAGWALAPMLELPSHRQSEGAPDTGALSQRVRWMRDQVCRALPSQGVQALLVQGDTATAYAGALAARQLGLPLLHVEAGLRSGNVRSPFPEEHFRRRIARLAAWHFAPTPAAAAHLRAEGVAAERIQMTGNTGIDTLRLALGMRPAALPATLGPLQHCVLLTLHRRENLGPRMDVVLQMARELLTRHPHLWLWCTLHPNPAVGARIRRVLGGVPRVQVSEALDYHPFVQVLARAALVITDSGGIQEEAPYLGVPMLIARDNTERPEALRHGVARQVRCCPTALGAAADALLALPRPDPVPFDARAPFGDGLAAARIVRTLEQAYAAVAA